MSAALPTTSPGDVNTATWRRGAFVGEYSGRGLRPVEVLLLLRYREQVAGRVLELGCGTGRIAGYLLELAKEVHGLDISAEMVEVCRRRYPKGHFSQGDVRDLSRFQSGSFGLVVAGCNLLDICADDERRAVLRDIRRVLTDDGLLIMSSHNRAYLPNLRSPAHVRCSDPLRFGYDLLNAPRRIVRHRRLRGLEREGPGYVILSDGTHEFSLVHYFISRHAQFRQFEQEGYEPLHSADLDGRALDAGYDAPNCPEIYYAARKRAPASSSDQPHVE